MQNDTAKELENITRLMEIAEESLKQINARLALLNPDQKNGHRDPEGLQSRVTVLKNNLDDLKEKRQLLTYFHSHNG